LVYLFVFSRLVMVVNVRSFEVKLEEEEELESSGSGRYAEAYLLYGPIRCNQSQVPLAAHKTHSSFDISDYTWKLW
jgi:hypothetical protein